MRREGLVYGLVFLGVVAAGVAVVVPRFLSGGRGSRPSPTPVAPPRPEEAGAPTVAAPPPPAWVVVRVVGPTGALRGPLKPVAGAEVEPLDAPDALAPRLRVRARAPVVSFGAAGHRWITLRASELAEDLRVVLPEASAPVVLRVREADGSVAANVPVEVLPATPGPARRTDAGGAIVVDDAAPGILELRVGGTERRGPTLRVLAGANEDVRATLEPAWRVAGRVVTPDAKPVAGATVVGIAPSGEVGVRATTGADGRFTWVGPATHPFALRVAASGWAERAVRAAPGAVGRLDVDVGDVVLEGPGGRIEGRVASEHVEPGATVAVEPAAAVVARELFGPGGALDVPRAHPLGPDGAFAFDDLPVGVPMRLTVRGAGVPVDDLGPAPAGAPRRVELSVPPGSAVAGTVVDGPTGKPAAGLRLLLSREARDGDLELPGDRVVTTDDAGRFEVRGLPGDAVFVRAFAPARRSLLRRIDLPSEREHRLGLEAAIVDAQRRVEGVVVDDAGAPLPGVTVRAAGVVGSTDAGGAFRLEGVESLAPSVTVAWGYEPGAAVAGIEPRGYAPVARLEVAAGGAPLRLVLPRAGGVRLRALDGITDEPVLFLHALVRGDGGRVLLDADVATSDGTIEWSGLAASGVTITLLTFDRRASVTTGIEPATTKDLGDVRLAHGVRARGVVLDEAGKPRAGATVAGISEGWLRAREGDPVPLRELPFRVTRTAADGTFVLEGLDPRDTMAITAWGAGLAPGVRRLTPEEIRAGPEARLDVRLKRGGYLLVHVGDARSGLPVLGALLDLEDARSGANLLDLVERAVLGGAAGSTEDWRAASEFLLRERDEPGKYLVGPLEPGPYRLLVDHPLYQPERRNLTVLPPGEALIGVRTAEMAADAPGMLSLLVELTPAKPR